MEKYDYMAAVCDDVRAYIESNEIKVTTNNRDELEEQLNEDLFCEDSVTGNASGSYTFTHGRQKKIFAIIWNCWQKPAKSSATIPRN